MASNDVVYYDLHVGSRRPNGMRGSSEEDIHGNKYQHQPRSMNPAEHERYNRQVLETGGFDVDVPNNVGNCGLIYPCPNFDKNPRVFEELNKCSSKAIEDFNNKHYTNYQFMRVVKVGSQAVAGCNHYITFEAKAKDAAPMYFQALVYAGIRKDPVVIFCRRKPEC